MLSNSSTIAVATELLSTAIVAMWYTTYTAATEAGHVHSTYTGRPYTGIRGTLIALYQHR